MILQLMNINGIEFKIQTLIQPIFFDYCNYIPRECKDEMARVRALHERSEQGGAETQKVVSVSSWIFPTENGAFTVQRL